MNPRRRRHQRIRRKRRKLHNTIRELIRGIERSGGIVCLWGDELRS